MGQFEGQAQAARGSANEIAHESMAYAEHWRRRSSLPRS
jgi:hypothetical protein